MPPINPLVAALRADPNNLAILTSVLDGIEMDGLEKDLEAKDFPSEEKMIKKSRWVKLIYFSRRVLAIDPRGEQDPEATYIALDYMYDNYHDVTPLPSDFLDGIVPATDGERQAAFLRRLMQLERKITAKTGQLFDLSNIQIYMATLGELIAEKKTTALPEDFADGVVPATAPEQAAKLLRQGLREKVEDPDPTDIFIGLGKLIWHHGIQAELSDFVGLSVSKVPESRAVQTKLLCELASRSYHDAIELLTLRMDIIPGLNLSPAEKFKLYKKYGPEYTSNHLVEMANLIHENDFKAELNNLLLLKITEGITPSRSELVASLCRYALELDSGNFSAANLLAQITPSLRQISQVLSRFIPERTSLLFFATPLKPPREQKSVDSDVESDCEPSSPIATLK